MTSQPRPVWLTREQRDWLYKLARASKLNDRDHLDTYVAAWDAAPSDPAEAVLLALLNAEHRSPGMGQEPEPLHDLYQPEGAAIVRKNAVLRALGGFAPTPPGNDS